MEIERKYLVPRPPPGWKKNSHSKIVQGYLPMASEDVEIRLRQRGDQCVITIKGGHGRTRLEEEFEIPKGRFKALWPLTSDARISKTRYRIPFGKHTIEMDVYEGPHRGLITADVEFDSKSECGNFVPPEWFGTEVTGNPEYGNANLARKGKLP